MKRKALFVGVNEYEDPQIRDLNYSLSDAHALKTLFELFGYQTDILENPSKSDVFRTVRNMTCDLSADDFFLFYFAGHGWTTTTGKHLLFCSDDQYEDLRYDYNVGIPFDILKKRTETGGYNRAFVLDACRSDFITGTRGDDTTTRDLRPIGELVSDAPAVSSLAVLRSCSQYEHALEIESRKHGLFTLAMMDVLRASKEAGAELLFGESLCDAVTQKMSVIAHAEGIAAAQTPEFAKVGIAQVLISGNKVPSDSSSGIVPSLVVCPVCFGNVRLEGTHNCVKCGKKYVCADCWDSECKCCAECARAARKDAEERSRAAGTRYVVRVGSVEVPLRWCPAGTFTMGSPSTEEGRWDDEVQHRVTLTKGFWMGETEVTQGLWKKVMGGETIHDLARRALRDDTKYKLGGKMQTLRKFWNLSRDADPSSICGDLGDDVPVYYVNWHDAVEFCARLTEMARQGGTLPEGYEFHLPTEAQWEYACRAGTTTALPNGRDIRILGEMNAPALDDIAWYGGNSSVGFDGRGSNTDGWKEKQYPGGRAAPRAVGKKKPNRWGLYDMIGNVWEWCADRFGDYSGDVVDPTGSASGDYRVLRGGSWSSDARRCRSAFRFSHDPGYRNIYDGFRLSCSVGQRGPGAEP